MMKVCPVLRLALAALLTLPTVVCLHCQELFPGLEGEELQQALRDNYRPNSTLDLTQAKDTLYLIVDRHNDSVSCTYSGFTVDLPDGVDPSQWVYQNGSGINLEHGYPQSKGADEGQPGHSNMHHLFPTRVAVNSARASFPFAEIPDQQTTTWFKGATSMSSIPTTDIDGYSEYRNGSFEPREQVKGDIARAMFYFYTMYQEDADAADPDFFPAQRATLCQWHLDDPADDAELQRSLRIAAYQDGKENPFIVDCSAALRAWCPEFKGCVSGTEDIAYFGIDMYLRTEDQSIVLTIESLQAQDMVACLFDMTGALIRTEKLSVMSGTSEFLLRATLPSGIYTVALFPGKGSTAPVTRRCVLTD